MNSICSRLPDELRKLGIAVETTYGYITKFQRQGLGLPKTHIEDAFVIAGGTTEQRLPHRLFQKQIRKCNRKLFKGSRSHLRNTADRFIKGFQRFDKVLWNGLEAFIFGRRSTGYFDIRKLDVAKLHASVKATGLVLLESFRTILSERHSEGAHPRPEGRSLRALGEAG